MAGPAVRWPDGKRFAFTVFDDTDLMNVRRGRPIYSFLDSLGMRVTKSVWLFDADGRAQVGGDTCDDPEYLEWVLEVQAAGHEIGYHNASDSSSERSRTIAALDRFEALFGHAPRVGADHAGNREALYGGPKRLTGVRALAYSLAQRVARPDRPVFRGEDPTGPWFWGDVCRERITYWRSFCFSTNDLLSVADRVVYHDPRRPYVNYWFTSTDGDNKDRFVRHLTPERLDALERSGGVCIMYTHFGAGFTRDGHVDPGFADAMERLARRSVWVAPVSTVLDHVRAQMPTTLLGAGERRQLEHRWIADRAADSTLLRTRKRMVPAADDWAEG